VPTPTSRGGGYKHVDAQGWAPLLVALVGLFSAATSRDRDALRRQLVLWLQPDEAVTPSAVYSACQQQNRVCYKLVYDTVMEKRWHTSYKTVCETVNKQVTKTCYRERMPKPCTAPATRPVTRTWSRNAPAGSQALLQGSALHRESARGRDLHEGGPLRTFAARCSAADEKEVCVTVWQSAVYEQHCHVACHQACHRDLRAALQGSQVPRQTDVSPRRCYKTVCCPVTRCVTEWRHQKVCVDRCKDVVETCYRDCVKKVCKAGDDVQDREPQVRRMGRGVLLQAGPVAHRSGRTSVRVRLRSVHRRNGVTCIASAGSPGETPGVTCTRKGVAASGCVTEQVPLHQLRDRDGLREGPGDRCARRCTTPRSRKCRAPLPAG